MPELTNVREKSSKEDIPASEYDEFMVLQNQQIQQAAAIEAEHKAAQDAKNEEFHSKKNPDAHCTVVVDVNGQLGDGQAFDTLDSIEIYGNKGMASYKVAEGDSLIKIVFVNSTPFTTAPAAKESEKKEVEKK